MPFNIRHHVRHIYQREDGLCWAAALAMITIGRDLDGIFEVVHRANITRENSSLLESEIPAAARGNRCQLVSPIPSPVTAADLAGFIANGPVALFLQLRSGHHSSMGGNRHVIVLRGVVGDGGPETVIHVNDPWITGGAHRTFSYLTSQYWASVNHVVRRA